MSVVFFDLVGTLVRETPGGYVPHPQAADWTTAAERAGLLCNAAPGKGARDVQRIAEEAGVLDALEPSLLVVATELPCPLPDRRAFAVAAAIAEAEVEDCVFVSADSALLIAAAAAGMRVLAVSWNGGPAPAAPAELSEPRVAEAAKPVPPAEAEEAMPAPAGEEEEPPQPAAGVGAADAPPAAGPVEVRTPGPLLFAGDRAAPAARPAIDTDEGPTFVLRGRAVTLAGQDGVIDDARVAVSRGRIVAVARPGEDLPEAFAGRVEIDTAGTIYPGLIDLHNHFVYNVLPLWVVPQPYKNRNQWPRHADYAATVTLPVRTLAAWPETARALVRYVEGKALIGGITTGQGIRTKVNGGARLFRGSMRNVEETDDPRLPEAGTRVPDLYANEKGIDSFRRALDSRTAYFYHLAEGIDEGMRRRFTDLRDNDLIRRSLVAIHCLGLEQADLSLLAAGGAKAVWSPFSNLLLYGRTIDPAKLKESGILFSIGCDWSPTGSKNLLQELKVARHVSHAADDAFTSEELVRAVTANAARVVGWHQYLGTLSAGAFADLLVLKGAAGDAYDALIDSGESDVGLVVTHGIPRYGDRELMQQLHAGGARPLEELTVDGAPKAFDLYTPESGLNDVTFAGARETLEKEMSDLPGLRERANAEGARLNSLGMDAPSFVVELDNEYVPTPDERQELGDYEAELMADWSKLAHSVPLDPPEVGAADYWERIDGQSNIDDELKAALRSAYGG